jgi:hypothetical protein
MPGLRRVGEVARAAARNPVRTALGLVATAMFIPQLIVLERRQRWKYFHLARQLGLTKGRVLRRAFTGGSATPRLTIITVRRGHWPEVLASLTSELARSGYQSPAPASPGGTPPQRLYYRPPRPGELPNLLLWVYAESETIGRADITVPAGHTGLQFSLA